MSNERIVVEVERDLEDLIPLFMEQRRKDRIAISRAVELKDMEALRAIGHGMAGGGRSYGFAVITEIGEAMERAARAHDMVTLSNLQASFSDFMERVSVKYV